MTFPPEIVELYAEDGTQNQELKNSDYFENGKKTKDLSKLIDH